MAVLGLVIAGLGGVWLAFWYVGHDSRSNSTLVEQRDVIGHLGAANFEAESTAGHPLSDRLAVPGAEYELQVLASDTTNGHPLDMITTPFFLARMSSATDARAALTAMARVWGNAGAVAVGGGRYRWTIPEWEYRKMRQNLVSQGLKRLLPQLHRTTYSVVLARGPFVALTQTIPPRQIQQWTHAMIQAVEDTGAAPASE